MAVSAPTRLAPRRLFEPLPAPPPGEVLLEARGVTLRYRTPDRVITATEGIDLDIRRGDRLVLLGPSGCGKSSLLRAVAGFWSRPPAASRSTAGGCAARGRTGSWSSRSSTSSCPGGPCGGTWPSRLRMARGRLAGARRTRGR